MPGPALVSRRGIAHNASMKRFALALLALISSAAPGAESGFGKLRFGMSPGDVEKVLGSVSMRRDLANPEIDSVRCYRTALIRDLLPCVYFDRSLGAVAFEFSYDKKENGGNNPRTGAQWEIPPDLGRWVLAQFAPAGQWVQLKNQGAAKVWRSGNGKVFARITASEILVSDREEIVRLKLRYW